MPEWLAESISLSSSLTLEQILVRLIVASAFGGCVTAIYRMSHGRTKPDSASLIATLVLLATVIAMVSMVIGDSVARAFSLVGALSIVRFRTVVEDTRDTAFVIFAVVVGMAAGAGLLLLPLAGIPIIGAAAVLLARFDKANGAVTAAESSLAIRLGTGRDPELLFGGILNRHTTGYRVRRVETAQKGAALDLQYAIALQPAANLAAFVAELNQVEGVQSVEVKS
jgi:uncharacterized membrane protein YhiD involved in acid resistance